MQKKKNRIKISNKIKLSNTVRMTVVLLSIIILAIGSGNLIKSIFTKTDATTQNEVVYKYSNKFSEDANVNLKDNAFILESEIEEGQTYLSDLISTIDLDMKYQYTGSKPTDVTYSYRIEAIMKSVYSNSKSSYDVLNKTEVLKEEKDKTASSENLLIDEKINIDYAKYHQTIKEFKQEMGINVDSYLYIKLIVDTKTNIDSQEVENEYVSNYSITLGDKIALIEDKSEEENTKSINAEKTVIQKPHINIRGIIVNAVVMLIGLILLRIVLTKTEKLNTIKNEYKLELNRILKSCESKLVQIEDLKQIDIENAVRVKDINQLLILSDEALVPIYCYIKDEPEEEAYFIVTKYEKSYIYILRQK